MRTIQEYLKECNREEVINNYIYSHTFDYTLMKDKYRELTVGEIIDAQKAALNDMIDRMINMKPKPDKDGEVWILMTVHSSEDESGDLRHILVKKSDVLDEKNEWITPYGYEFTPHEEVVGFYVADTYLTQYWLTELIEDFLFEASWTGYNQEHLQETLDELDKSVEEIENGTAVTHTWEEVQAELEKDGFTFEKKDKEQEEAWHKYIKACGEYARKCQEIEIKKLREMLIEEEM